MPAADTPYTWWLLVLQLGAGIADAAARAGSSGALAAPGAPLLPTPASCASPLTAALAAWCSLHACNSTSVLLGATAIGNRADFPDQEPWIWAV